MDYAMTNAAEQVLRVFDALSEDEQQWVYVQILRRGQEWDSLTQRRKNAVGLSTNCSWQWTEKKCTILSRGLAGVTNSRWPGRFDPCPR